MTMMVMIIRCHDVSYYFMCTCCIWHFALRIDLYFVFVINFQFYSHVSIYFYGYNIKLPTRYICFTFSFFFFRKKISIYTSTYQ
jgi:hypothetical protein